MARLKPKLIPDLERIIEFVLVRATEAAALGVIQGRGRLVTGRQWATQAEKKL